MAGRTPKVTAEQWTEAARVLLVEEGVAGVRVDTLASRLGVTRGGFYHNFRDRGELLAALLHLWEAECRFLPTEPPGQGLAEAGLWLERLVERLIDEDGYDPRFDMAVREWARSDPRAAWAVERSDRERMAGLEVFFLALGYDSSEAATRARVFYFHQVGYYAIGIRQSPAERKRNARLYTDILCGPDAMERLRAAGAPPRARARRG